MVRQNEQRLSEEAERHARSDAARRNLETEIRTCKHDLAKLESQVQKQQLNEKQYVKQYEEKRQRLGTFRRFVDFQGVDKFRCLFETLLLYVVIF